jgi:hypothetical protein
MSGALSRDASLQFERSMQSVPPQRSQEYNPMWPFLAERSQKHQWFQSEMRPDAEILRIVWTKRTQWAALLAAASQCLVSLTLGFGKFALEPPAGADPVLTVIGLPGLVFITQGPSGQVKHP